MNLINWIEAARPKTLFASLSPVIVGGALAWHDEVFRLAPFLLCVLVALTAQIASNLANDYFDFKKGADGADRLGPARAVASGWVTPKAMLKATVLMLTLCCTFGLGLLYYGGLHLIWVGIVIVIFALAYTGGPYPLAYHGLGDVCVLLFFGVVPVSFTYYVQALTFTPLLIALAFAMGFLSINILVVNNYRDYEQDKRAGKRTTIVCFGKRFGQLFYLFNLLATLLCTLPLLLLKPALSFLPLLFILFFTTTWMEMRRSEGVALNQVLAATARNVLFYACVLSFLLLYV